MKESVRMVERGEISEQDIDVQLLGITLIIDVQLLGITLITNNVDSVNCMTMGYQLNSLQHIYL